MYFKLDSKIQFAELLFPGHIVTITKPQMHHSAPLSIVSIYPSIHITQHCSHISVISITIFFKEDVLSLIIFNGGGFDSLAFLVIDTLNTST